MICGWLAEVMIETLQFLGFLGEVRQSESGGEFWRFAKISIFSILEVLTFLERTPQNTCEIFTLKKIFTPETSTEIQ